MIRHSALPDRWPIVPLGEVVEFLDSKRRPITKKDRIEGPYPYYGANGQQDSVADYIFDEPLVLLAEDGGHFGDPEKTIAYRVDGKCWVNNHAHVLRPTDQIDGDYLCRHLERYDVLPFISGTTRAKLTKGAATKISISLPPLPEQRRIAAILDKADAVRRKRKEAIRLCEDFLRSAFLEMFGDPVTNPMGWESGSIDDVVANPKSDVRCGPFGTQLKVGELVPSGVPLLGIENVQDGKFSGETSKFLTPEKAEYLHRFDVQPYDVLVTRMGTIGRSCIVPPGFEDARISYHLFRLRPDPSRCLPGFLSATISRSGTFMAQLRQMAHGAIMAGLSTGNLRQVQFLLPPVSLQEEYLSQVAVADQLLGQQLTAETENEYLFSSLVQRAFGGDL